MPFSSGKHFSLVLLILFAHLNYANNVSEVTIGFVGDVMLGRLVSEMLVQKLDYAYPWGNLLSVLKSTDFNIANLETTLAIGGIKALKTFNFKSHLANVEALLQANIQIVNLANNHILDFGQQGLEETVATLDAVGIKHVGAGLTLQHAQTPALLNKKNIRFAVLGFTDNEPTWLAAKNKTGINYIKIDPEDFDQIDTLIKKTKLNTDFLIVSIHWGGNWEEQPSKPFQEFAHKLIDAGVDIIHGHSPHIFQGVEIYKNKLIMYSPGDFLDDYAIDDVLRNDQSFLFLVTVDKNGLKELRLIPVMIKNMQVNKAEGIQAQMILQRMKTLSSHLGILIK